MTPDTRRARLEELLGTEATQGLSPAEATELDALLEAFPDEDPDSFERAAAAVHLALAGTPEEMPPALVEKLHLAAVAFVPMTSPRPPRAARRAWAIWAGWAVAAGLAGVLIYTNWPQPDSAARRAKLERDPTAAAKSFVGEKAGVSATVVWSNAKQEGYLEVRGLPANDPKKEQYQLWIVDGGRAKKLPVDGGVFDVKPDGTALVPVRNPIQVKDARAFAITKEIAGGVVESDGPMLLVLTPKSG